MPSEHAATREVPSTVVSTDRPFSFDPSDDDEDAVDLPDAVDTRGAIDLTALGTSRRIPGWVIRAIALYWVGYVIVAMLGRVWDRLAGLGLLLLISLFLSLAIEPGVNEHPSLAGLPEVRSG